MEPDRYLLMMLAHDDGPHGPRMWAAATLGGVGRALTRDQAEALAAHVSFSPRFLFPYNEDSARFAQESGAPTLAMMPGEAIWSYGEPTRTDMMMMMMMRSAFGTWPGDSAPSPDPDVIPLLVSAVVEIAQQALGPGDAHSIETAFDELVMELGGMRHDDPPYYGVPIGILDTG